MNAIQITAIQPTIALQCPSCHGTGWNRLPAMRRSRMGMPYAMYRPMTAIDVTAAYAVGFHRYGRPRMKAPTAANQMELVGVRVRLLIRCQNSEPGTAPSREKA